VGRNSSKRRKMHSGRRPPASVTSKNSKVARSLVVHARWRHVRRNGQDIHPSEACLKFHLLRALQREEHGRMVSPATSDIGILQASGGKGRGRHRPRKRQVTRCLHVRYAVVPSPLLSPDDDLRLEQTPTLIAKHPNAWAIHLRQDPIPGPERHQRAIMNRNPNVVEVRELDLIRVVGRWWRRRLCPPDGRQARGVSTVARGRHFGT
jgi:hypothetical protein